MPEIMARQTTIGIVREKLLGLADNPPGEILPAIALSAAYIALYLVLDRLSFIEALYGVDITPWNPPAGLTLALLIVGGIAYMPVVVVATLVSRQLLPLVSIPPTAALTAALVVAVGYAGAAGILRHVLRFDRRLQHTRDVVMLIIAATIGAGFVALGFVTTYAAEGVISWADFRTAALQFWLGDAIGAVVFTPLLLVLLEKLRGGGLSVRRRNWFGILEIVAQWASIGGALALVFGFHHDRYSFQLFYFLFLPLVWIATRRGLGGASWAVFTIQAALIATLEFEDKSGETIRAFQLLMFAVAATGLILGAVVSERRRVARALAESEGRLTAILNAARDGVLTVDAGGRIETVNPAVEELFGRPARLLIGTDVRYLFDRPDILQRLTSSTSLSRTEPLRLELNGWRENGAVFPVELTAGHFGAAGSEHYTLVVRDITLRRDAEARQRQRQSEVAQVSRLSLAGEMASALAHEINQPLMAITTYARGCLRLLRQTLLEPSVLREGIEQVLLQAGRASDIIVRLREFVRTGASQRSSVDVKSLLDAAVALAQAEATQNGIDIEARVAVDLPNVLADRIQIEQVLLNLLRNAMDAIVSADTDRRTIVIEAKSLSGKALEISVADTGPGLAEEVASRLFEAFVTTKPHGMGLGLSISRSIVEAHDGHLRLHRTSGSGAVFAFDLPVYGGARGHAG